MKTQQVKKSVLWMIALVAIIYYLLQIVESSETGLIYLLCTVSIICFLQFLIALFLIDKGPDSLPQKGIFSFFIGDEGGYSLSRLQAVTWAIVIMSYQIGLMVIMKKNGDLSYYQLTFSEQTLWLLGLSMTTAISVKALTVSRLETEPAQYKKKRTPRFSDILTGENGLDFSRCQMLIWTILGLFIFINKSNEHLQSVNTVPGQLPEKKEILYNELFSTHTDEFQTKQNVSITTTGVKTIPVPFLPWSFIILMGLSQGTYIGKKLIPVHKLDEIKESKQEELNTYSNHITVKKNLLEQILANSTKENLSPLDIANKKSIENEIKDIELKILNAKQEISQINQFRTADEIA